MSLSAPMGLDRFVRELRHFRGMQGRFGYLFPAEGRSTC